MRSEIEDDRTLAAPMMWPYRRVVVRRRQPAAGEAPFEPYGSMALRTLYTLGRFVLVSRTDVPSDPAYLVTEALGERLGVGEVISFSGRSRACSFARLP